MSVDGYGRRRFLYRAGIVVTAGALAGCADGNGSGDTGTATGTTGSGGAVTTTMATETDAPTATETTATGTTTGAETAGGTTAGATDTQPVTEPAPPRVDRFLEDALFYNGDMVVGVPFVGVGASDTNLVFDPAAIKVATGTEVTWQWVGGQERHVVASIGTPEGGRAFSSPPNSGSGFTYRHTFTSPGMYRYTCGVHRTQDTRGAVVVAPGSEVGGPGPG